MKSIKALFALVLAASLASASLAETEIAPPLVRVPKTEAAMQATRATTAKDAANDPAPPTAHKTKAKQGKTLDKQDKTKTKAKQGKTKTKQVKGASAKKGKTKTHAAK